MDKKIVVFGCGKLGHEAINVLGSENIECFCDNNPTLAGTEKFGKRVITFEELRAMKKDAVVIICANIRYGNSYAMAEQCEEQGIGDYFFYQLLREKNPFCERAELISFLADTVNRQALKNEMLIRRTKELQQQVDYLKRHIDIKHIRPAQGTLRAWQLTVVKTAAELLEKLSELEIKPFLYGGNLIGYVRHNGFVPWDDDMDFVLMRKEYEALKEYCRLHMYTETEFYGENKNGKDVRRELEGYYYGNGGGDEFNIYYPLPDGSKVVTDFFVLDYYAQDYAFETLMNMKEEVKCKLNDAITGKAGGAIYDDEKRIACFQAALKENEKNLTEESDHIYFGIDNMDMLKEYHRGGWIPKEVVFPLKKVLYEGTYFYVPNESEEFLKYEFENIWELPNDIGIPQHIWYVGCDLTDVEKW